MKNAIKRAKLVKLHRYWNINNRGNSDFFKQILIAFAFNAKSFAIGILVFFCFLSLPVHFSGRTAKSFLVNVLRLVIKKACGQDLTHSLDTPKNIFVKIVPEVVIRDACGTWHGFCMVTSIYSIQKSTRNSQNSETSQLIDDRRFKGPNRQKSS